MVICMNRQHSFTWFLCAKETPFTIQRFSGKTCTQTYKFFWNLQNVHVIWKFSQIGMLIFVQKYGCLFRFCGRIFQLLNLFAELLHLSSQGFHLIAEGC